MRQLGDYPAVVLAWRNAGNVAVSVENDLQLLKALTCVGQLGSHWVYWSQKACYEYFSDIQHLSESHISLDWVRSHDSGYLVSLQQ